MLDLHFSDQSVFKFLDTFYVSDDFGSNHSSTSTNLNIVIQNRFGLKAKINLKIINQIVRQKYKNSVLNLPVYQKAEELDQFNEVFVQIIQVYPTKIFPCGDETTNPVREKKKKEES